MKTPAEKCVEVLNWARKNYLITNQQFEIECGISAGAVGRWIKGERMDIAATTVSKILCRYPAISADWMMRDEAGFDMFGGKPVGQVRDESPLDYVAKKSPATVVDDDYTKHLIDEVEYLRAKLDAANETIQKMAVMIAESRTVG